MVTLNVENVANAAIGGTFFFPAAGQSAQLVGRYTGSTGTGTGDDNLYFAAMDTQANGDTTVHIVKRVNRVQTQVATPP